MRSLLIILLVLLALGLYGSRRGPSPETPQLERGQDIRAEHSPADLSAPETAQASRNPALEPAAHVDAEPESTTVPDCTLDLRVVEADSAAPTSSRVTLWRLDVPAADGWTAGDELLGAFDVPITGALREGLVPGRYMALAHDGARGDEGLVRFAVAGPYTRVGVPLIRPAQHHVTVRLYDDQGLRIMRLERIEEYSEFTVNRPNVPADLKPRWIPRALDSDPLEEEDLPEEEFDMEEYGMRESSSFNAWQWIEDLGSGFDFGSYSDPSRGGSQATGFLFRAGELRARGQVGGEDSWRGFRASASLFHHSERRGQAGGEASRDRVYVGVLPDPTAYRDLIVLPDRRDGHDIAQFIQVSGGLLLLDEVTDDDPEADPWRLVPIEVRVEHPDYEPVTLTHRLADPMPPEVRLRAKKL
jgi:hypothetical protein